jgi:hypothetical protein
MDEKPPGLGEIYKRVKRYRETNSDSPFQLSRPLNETNPLQCVSDIIEYTANGSKDVVVREIIESYDNASYLACSNTKCPLVKIFIDENYNKKCKTCFVSETRD